MTKSSSWGDFSPSFAFAAVGQLRKLEEAAFDAARALADVAVAGAVTSKVIVEGVLDANALGAAGPDRWLNFGHEPVAGGTIWSNALPFRLSIEFGGNDEVDKVALTLFLANPHFSLSASDFLPARYSADQQRVEMLAPAGGRIGFALLSAAGPVETPAQVYARLLADLPNGATAAPAGFQDHAVGTLVGRIDLSCTWTRQVEQHLGAWVGTPGGGSTEALGKLVRLKLFSSATDQDVHAFVHKSRKYALRLPADPLKAPVFILDAPQKPKAGASADEQSAWAAYRQACQEFALNAGFKGFLLQGLSGSWLDDDLSLSASRLTATLDVLAVSFGDVAKEDGREAAGLCFAMSLQVQNDPNAADPNRPFLGWFSSPATLRVSYGFGGLRYLTLEGAFAASLDKPYQWLAGRAFSLSVAQLPWKDAAGAARKSWSVELGLEKADDKYLARVPIAGDPVLSAAVIALSFAPIVFMTPKPPQAPAPAPDAQSRGYFVNVASGSNITQVFVAAALGKFLSERIAVRELRVTGAHLRSQPSIINDAHAGDGLETALLLDYDVDYDVDLHELGLSTTRAISTHIDGTGFVVGSAGVRWVQVPNGAFELGISDPGLWNLGAVGKFLKLADIRLRKAEHTSLVTRLRLAQNFGGVKADDFEISIDLKSSQVKFESFPARVEVEVASAFKGRGVLHIGTTPEGERDVAGGIDLAFLSLGWRIYGGLRITHVRDLNNERHLALLAGLAVEWPTKIPLLNTGFGISGLQLIYATHFLRNEPPKIGAIPPALGWLQKADGNVPESVENPLLWKALYGRNTIGIGLEAGLMVGGIMNINALLAIEQPGPRILVFVKITLLKSQKKNKGNTELTGGILGVLDIDFAQQTITVAVLANLNLGSLLDMHVPMEFGASMVQLSRWHIYLGHFDSPVTVDLKLVSLIKAGVRGYLMFDGYRIVGLPQESGPAQTLPGFAVAFGLWASVRIGTGAIYLEVSFKAFVQLSLSRVLYAEGVVVLSGIIHLWKFDVGASGRWSFLFLRDPDHGTQYQLKGSICGYIKVWRWKIRGCVGLTIGSGVPDTTQLDDLIRGFAVVSGAQAILLGQGAFNPIDAALPSLEAVGIDSILVLSMDVPPAIKKPGAGFAKVVPQPTKKAEFQLGTKKGTYTVTGVTLRKRAANGALIDVSYADTPARWWRNPAKQNGGHPAPLSLALMTRNPLNFENAILNPGAPGGVLDEMLEGLCDPPITEQYAMYLCYPPLQGGLEAGQSSVQGLLGTPDLERDPGYDAIPNLSIDVLDVSPLDNEAVHLLNEVIDDVQVPGIELGYFFRRNQKNAFVAPRLKLSCGGFWSHRLIQVCLAVPRTYSTDRIARLLELRQGGVTIPIGNALSVHDLAAAFDFLTDGMANWTAPCSAFLQLNKLVDYSRHLVVLVTIELGKLALAEDPTDLVIGTDYNDINKPERVVVGPIKLTPSLEHSRYLAELQHKSDLQDELNEYLKGNDQPLLEPDSEYVVEVNYQKKLGGNVVAAAPSTYAVKTSPTPPSRLDPYLLATYPEGVSQRSMPTSDTPAVLISTHDILRILDAYGARLRVTITHDGGAPLTDATATINWKDGATFSPADLRLPNPPTGIKTARHPGWESATGKAIREAIDNKQLSCISAEPIDRALWIGFDVVLHPMASYGVRVDLVDAADAPVFADGAPFYAFSFTTGLYPTMSDLAKRVANGVACRRLMRNDLPNFSFERADRDEPTIAIVADKELEDILFAVTGERQVAAGQPDYTLLVRSKDGIEKPAAIVVRSNEPFYSSTVLPQSGTIADANGVAIPTLLGQATHPIWGPKPLGGLPPGVKRFFISESGLSGLIVLDDNADQQDLVITLKRRWTWLEGAATAEEETLLTVPAALLRARSSVMHVGGSI